MKLRVRPYPKTGTDTVDLEICKLVEGEPLIPNTEIARRLGIDRDTVGSRRARSAWRALWEERNPPARSILSAYQGPAATVYVKMLLDEKNTPPAVRERIARVVSGADQKPVQVKVTGEVKGDIRLGLSEETKRRIAARYGFGDAPAGGGRKRAGNPRHRTRAA